MSKVFKFLIIITTTTRSGVDRVVVSGIITPAEAGSWPSSSTRLVSSNNNKPNGEGWRVVKKKWNHCTVEEKQQQQYNYYHCW